MLKKFLQTSALTLFLVGLDTAGCPKSAKAAFQVGIPNDFVGEDYSFRVDLAATYKIKQSSFTVLNFTTKHHRCRYVNDVNADMWNDQQEINAPWDGGGEIEETKVKLKVSIERWTHGWDEVYQSGWIQMSAPVSPDDGTTSFKNLLDKTMINIVPDGKGSYTPIYTYPHKG